MATVPSVPFFGILDEDHLNQLQQQQQQSSASASTPSSSAAAAPQQAAPLKKKRNLPGTPYPDAEVVALSPKTLMATNRFVCDVCNKGFQREQNLQLHRRGHNLPWKLKRKSAGEVRRRRVYLCPEPTCAHHDPSRALGDLTGIKKHFSRKHGEKKWKCDKCSKRYAVQSDWRAHSKVCGTREYRCDCGTLFSRRDSFITHRAFCDALAQESSRLPAGLNPMGSHLYGNSSGMGLGLSQLNLQISSLQDQSHPSADLLRLGGGGGGVQFDHLIPPSNPSSIFYPGGSSQDFSDDTQSHQSFLQTKPFHGLMHLPDIQSNANVASSPSAAAANLFNLSNNAGNPSTHLLISDQFNNAGPTSLFSGALMSNQMSGGPTSLYNTSAHNEGILPQMSATALLQKAAQMGATTSDGNGSSLLRGYGSSSSSYRASFGGGGGGESLGSQYQNEANLQGLMNSLSNGGGGRGHEMGFGGFGRGMASMDESKLHQNLTRDFLGVGSMVRSMGRGVSQREQHHGVDMDLFDAEMKPASSHRSFSGGNLQ